MRSGSFSRLTARAWAGIARSRSASRHLLPAACVLALLLNGCGTLDEGLSATRTAVSAIPTATLTPSGDLLRINGEIVRAVLIPNPSQSVLYALTDTDLYHYHRGLWEPTGAGNTGSKLLVDPTNPERILRGDHPSCSATATPDTIRFEVSEDGGLRWRVHHQGLNVRPLLFDGALPKVVYGSDCGLAISSSAGVRWERHKPFEGYDVVALAATGERLYVMGVSRHGISQLRSIDVSDPDAPVVSKPLLEVSGVATLDAEGGRIVVGAVDAVHISDDAGATWAKTRIGLEQITFPPTVVPERGPGGGPVDDRGIQVIHIQPGNIHRVYAGTPHGLYISQDDGVSWVRYSQIPVDASVIDIQFALDGADLYITTTKGVVVVPAP